MRRLYTFRISHFSEKARWALDLQGLPYEESTLLPGPHLATIRRLAKRSTVPVLVDGDTVIQGSAAILDHAERLGGRSLSGSDDARARELEALADHAFGTGIQRIFYATLLDRPKEVAALWTQGGPWWGRPLYALTFPVLARNIRKLYRIEPVKVAEAKDAFFRAFDMLDAILADGAPYLVGDRISRADLAVASLLAPACTPPEHVVRWPTDVPPELDAFLAPLRGRPTWDFVLRTYRGDRRPTGQAEAAARG